MTRVVAFGTFDVLHPGHKHFLIKAATYGEELCVVISRDATVQKVKNHPTVQNEETRRAAVEELPQVTKAVLGGTGSDKMEIVRTLRPDVICLGYDQTHFVDVLTAYIAERNLPIKLVRIDALEPERYKSSILNSNNKPSK